MLDWSAILNQVSSGLETTIASTILGWITTVFNSLVPGLFPGT